MDGKLNQDGPAVSIFLASFTSCFDSNNDGMGVETLAGPTFGLLFKFEVPMDWRSFDADGRISPRRSCCRYG